MPGGTQASFCLGRPHPGFGTALLPSPTRDCLLHTLLAEMPRLWLGVQGMEAPMWGPLYTERPEHQKY